MNSLLKSVFYVHVYVYLPVYSTQRVQIQGFNLNSFICIKCIKINGVYHAFVCSIRFR